MDSELSIATIRSLGIDMINKAKSGHPGMVLDAAPAYTRSLRKNYVLILSKQSGTTVIASY